MVSLEILFRQRRTAVLTLVVSSPQNQEFLSLCKAASCHSNVPSEILTANSKAFSRKRAIALPIMVAIAHPSRYC